jgi:hypothetical protein
MLDGRHCQGRDWPKLDKQSLGSMCGVVPATVRRSQRRPPTPKDECPRPITPAASASHAHVAAGHTASKKPLTPLKRSGSTHSTTCSHRAAGVSCSPPALLPGRCSSIDQGTYLFINPFQWAFEENVPGMETDTPFSWFRNHSISSSNKNPRLDRRATPRALFSPTYNLIAHLHAAIGVAMAAKPECCVHKGPRQQMHKTMEPLLNPLPTILIVLVDTCGTHWLVFDVSDQSQRCFECTFSQPCSQPGPARQFRLCTCGFVHRCPCLRSPPEHVNTSSC